MKKFKFNSDLISCLPNVLDITLTEIARRCKLNQPTLRMYIIGERALPVQVLLTLCNTLRMPSRYFIYPDDEPGIIPTRETATIEAHRWQSVSWDERATDTLFGDAPEHIFWKDVAAAMGISDQRPRERFALRTRFPVADFLQVCNAFGISPFTFIIDRNLQQAPTDPTGSGRETTEHKRQHTRHNDSSVAELRRQVADLTDMVANLTEKYNTLLAAHNNLARRVSFNIETMNDFHLSVASEHQPKYPKGQKDD